MIWCGQRSRAKGNNPMVSNKKPQGSQQPPKPGQAHKLLDVFIGKWLNEGETVANANAPSVRIVTSDVYEWVPGGFFVLHTAYGRIGRFYSGGMEIIVFEAGRKNYKCRFVYGQSNDS